MEKNGGKREGGRCRIGPIRGRDLVCLGMRSQPGRGVATWLDSSRSQAWRPIFCVTRGGGGGGHWTFGVATSI